MREAVAGRWCIEATSASTFSMVGALNKSPLAILEIFIFNNPLILRNLPGVTLGLTGGILFSFDRYSAAISLASAPGSQELSADKTSAADATAPPGAKGSAAAKGR